MAERKRFLGLTVRKEKTCLTRRGWIVLALSVFALCFTAVRLVHPYLALTKPLPSGILVVEGWAPDYAFEFASGKVRSGQYSHVFVTGGPLEYGAPLSSYKTYAEAGAAVLLSYGVPTNQVTAVPAPAALQDRTFVSAVALRKYFESRNVNEALTLVSMGPHSRRSRFLFEMAFGRNKPIGIIAVPVREFDGAAWWRTSAGFRTVVDEAVAYFYFRFFFHPDVGRVLDSMPAPAQISPPASE